MFGRVDFGVWCVARGATSSSRSRPGQTRNVERWSHWFRALDGMVLELLSPLEPRPYDSSSVMLTDNRQ